MLLLLHWAGLPDPRTLDTDPTHPEPSGLGCVRPGFGTGANDGTVVMVSNLSDKGNLYPYGPGTRDVKLVDREAQTGRQVDLLTYFPYYGARYNYSIVSICLQLHKI